MATHKSAEKRARVSARRNKRNSMTMSTLRSFEKKLRAAIAAKDLKLAEQALVAFSSKVDKAATKKVLHTKTASRKVSRLATAVSNLK